MAGAIALIVMGALVGIFALLALLVGVAGESILELADPSLGDFGPGLMTAIVVIAIILLILAALHFAAGIGVLAHRTWARWLGIVIGALGLVFGVLMMLGGVGDRSLDATDWLIPLAWTGAYLLAIGGLAAGSRHFSQVNP